MTVQDKLHLNFATKEFKKQKHKSGNKKKNTIFASSQSIVYWYREMIPCGFIEKFSKKLSIDVDPDTESFQ